MLIFLPLLGNSVSAMNTHSTSPVAAVPLAERPSSTAAVADHWLVAQDGRYLAAS